MFQKNAPPFKHRAIFYPFSPVKRGFASNIFQIGLMFSESSVACRTLVRFDNPNNFLRFKILDHRSKNVPAGYYRNKLSSIKHYLLIRD